MKVIASVFSNEMEILSGANVTEVGTGKTTITDASGRFAIDVANENAQLKISHMGYDFDTFPVNSGEIKNYGYVTLYPSTTELDPIDVKNAKKTDYTLAYLFGGLLATIAAFKIFGKSEPQPRKIKV